MNQLCSTFFKIIQHNKIEELKIFLNCPENYNCFKSVNNLIQNKSGDTALHICATLGPDYFGIFKYLVEEHDANIESLNKDMKTPLHDAAQFSNYVIVDYLIKKGANVNVVKRADWTPLMLICTKNDEKIVSLLLSAGADSQFTNKDGWNCVHIASREGSVRIVEIILNSVKDKEERMRLVQKQSKNGRRPLHSAVMHGHLPMVQFLISQCSSQSQIHAEDHCGTTPLMDCCRFTGKEYLKILKLLISHDGDLRRCNRIGQNCLHIAAESGQNEMVQELVQVYGMDVNCSDGGLTALHWAAKEGHQSTMDKLIQLGADPLIEDIKGRTVMDISKAFGYMENAPDVLV